MTKEIGDLRGQLGNDVVTSDRVESDVPTNGIRDVVVLFDDGGERDGVGDDRCGSRTLGPGSKQSALFEWLLGSYLLP